MELQKVKQRFGIIGNNPVMNRAIDIAMQVAPTDLSVMGTRTHTSHGAGDEVPVELPEFTDDLVIKLERIRETERTVIPGTQ